MTTFEDVRPLADTVLYEGYALYPYRADDQKNQVRWQFGVLMPPAMVVADPSERSGLIARLLAEGRQPRFTIRLRFLQAQRRTVEEYADGGPHEVARLDAGDTTYLPFDEAVPHELDVDVAADGAASETFEVAGTESLEEVPGGRLRRRSLPLTLSVTASTEQLPGPYGVTRLTVRVANTTDWQGTGRVDALRGALIAAHVLVLADGGRLLSMTDPPEWATAYVAESPSEGVWPVLVGPVSASDLVLCTPIILGDHPEVAAESPTPFFDATEIDEMLSLRTMTLTDEEKRAMRGTDPRTAELLDRVEDLPPELMDRLHGAVRYLGQKPRRVREEPPDSLDVKGVSVGVGSRVLLRPGVRRADAQDLFLAGRTALVQKVLHDVDGGDHLAVLLEEDEGYDVALAHGRYLFFAPDEVEPLGSSS